jgi:putative oxidoreductase
MYKNRTLSALDKLYRPVICSGHWLQGLLLLYMRLTWGHQFFLAGLHKFHTLDQTTSFFSSLGIPTPWFQAYLVAGVETICGSALVVGFASRLISIPLLITMLVALSTAHAANISEFRFLFEPLKLVHETPYPFLITSWMVWAFGPGVFSIDAWIHRWLQKQPTL